MEELIKFLDKYKIGYSIKNGHIIAHTIDLSWYKINELPESFHLIKCTNLYLYNNKISKLPDNFHLIKCECIDLSNNSITELPENFHLIKCKEINLSHNFINKLPENFHLLKCNTIDLSHNSITELPDNFHLIESNDIYLDNNKISKLPENIHLLKCNYLYLNKNNLKKLPENFHLLKCYYIALSRNMIRKLPKNLHLVKCSYLYVYTDLSIPHQNFNDVEITDDYIYCDNRLTWITGKKQVNEFTVYIGRFGEVVVTKDNKKFAHGKTLRQAISDLLFKLSDRNKNEYIDLDKNVQLPINDMIVMYRTITGACSLGVENFMHNKNFNETISLNEINNIIGDDYGSKSFREFFKFE
jgi:hypothetical protein